jgi:O-antigen ligase
VGVTNEVRALIVGIMTLALFVLFASRADPVDLKVLRNPIFIVFLFYWFTVTFSICIADNFGEALNESLVVFTRIVLLFAATIVLRNQKWFARALILVTIALGILSVYQFMAVLPHLRKGLMGNKNQAASAFFLLSVLCVYYWRQWKVAATIALILSAFAIVTLKARSSYLAVLVAVLAFTLTHRKYYLVGVVILPMASGLIWVLTDSGVIDSRSLKQRIDTWTQTCRMIRDYPMGIGAGNWQIKFPVYAGYLEPANRLLTYELNQFHIHAHNDWLQKCSEVGYIGMASYLLLFALALWYSKGVIRAGIAGYMAIACFTFPDNRPFHSMMLMIFFALAILQNNHVSNDYIITRWPSLYAGRRITLLSFLIGSVLVFSVYVFAVRYETSRKTMRIYQARLDGQWKTIMVETQRISPFATIDPHSTTPLRFYRGFAFFAEGKNSLARRSFDLAQKDNPNHLFSVMNMAYSYILAGELDLAGMYYQKAKKMYPDFKDIDEAMRVLDVLSGRLIGEGPGGDT